MKFYRSDFESVKENIGCHYVELGELGYLGIFMCQSSQVFNGVVYVPIAFVCSPNRVINKSMSFFSLFSYVITCSEVFSCNVLIYFLFSMDLKVLPSYQMHFLLDGWEMCMNSFFVSLHVGPFAQFCYFND